MKVISILTAVVVCVTLYFLVIEREALLTFATGGTTSEAAVPAEAETPTEITNLASAVEDDSAVPVVARRSTAEVIDSAVIVRGRTEAARQVDVKAETSGLVISTPLRKGARVAEGELLCEIDVGTRDASLAEAMARLEGAKASLADAEINENAASRLSEDGFASETRLTAAKAAKQSAKANVQSAEAAIAAAEKELERLQIRAPFAGLLESDTAETGSLLQPGALCATVLQLDPIKLVGFVPETEVSRVETGADAAGRLASGEVVTGTVTFISRSADQNTRTFQVEVTAGNTEESIRDGHTVEIVIASDGATAHLLPQSALTLDNDGALGVRLVDDNSVVAFAPVTILRDTNEGVWVAGLAEEVAVITVGQEYVTDGVSVRPNYEGETQ